MIQRDGLPSSYGEWTSKTFLKADACAYVQKYKLIYVDFAELIYVNSKQNISAHW